MNRFKKLFFFIPLIGCISGWLGVRPIFAQEVAQTDSLSSLSHSDSTSIKIFSTKKRQQVSTLLGRKRGRLYDVDPNDQQVEVSWDSVGTFKIQLKQHGFDILPPTVVDFETYRRLKKEQQKLQIREELVKESKAQQDERKGLLDFSINVPGGENSAFTTIFGTNEVNLRVNGSANMTVGASVQKTDDGTLSPDLRTRVDPTFNQDLQLNIQGTIGDKLTIATDWDTKRQFDFENRLSIVYRGYEDEIIKSIEMGNVSMATGNSLVSGGSALFGIKAISELGPLKVTTVISQQKGESSTQKISGGSQEKTIELRPADYEDGKHIFLDFYNRQFFETAVANPQEIQQPYQITEIHVYVRKSEQVPGINTVNAIALLDFGVNDLGNGQYGLPGNQYYHLSADSLELLRPSNSNATNADFGATPQEYVDGIFEELVEGEDYTVNYILGFITINTFLNSSDDIAVAYTYTTPELEGNVVQVGEVTPRSSSRTYLKLIRPGGMTTEDKAWDLTMRNIYNLGVSNIVQDGFELEINNTRNNIPEVSLPGRSETLLEDLGLDRLKSDGTIGSDQQIDFSGITLDAGNGRIMFPYLEPFGERIEYILKNNTNADDSTIAELSFKELYSLKPTDARRQSKNSFYSISGVSKGGVSGNFYLGFGLVEGSVKVVANGVELIEGTDYEVDYSFGSLTILNDKYLAVGQEIEVEYESNQFAQIGQKNFTGVRAEYTLSDDISIGGTYFHLKEQPLTDKIRIGTEPINNTVLGLDAKANFDAPWLTRAIDKIPLLQTKASSTINFSGEFAQLRPGVAQTNAVQEAIDNGILYPDEENGLVFIDDFEGAKYSISLVNPTRWHLAAAPAALPYSGIPADENHFAGLDSTSIQSLEYRKLRADLRAQFSWYSIPRNISSISDADRGPETEKIRLTDIYKGRVLTSADINEITPLDVYFDPSSRGQYNYNYDLKNLLELTPERTWGGMTTVIPPGQEDLVLNNIEFLEFWVQMVLPDGEEPDGLESYYEGKLFIDLGTISEDVVPNTQLNTEDGFSTVINNLIEDDPSGVPRSYIPPTAPVPLGQFSSDKRALEDVGLDGAPDPGTPGAEDRDESVLFEEFIAVMRNSYGEDSPEFQAILEDPSNDNYMYYGEDKARSLPVNERFFRLLGYHEGNTPESGNSEGQTAITLKPDTEGLVSSSSIIKTNAYFQYELDLNPADRDRLEIGTEGTYIVDKIRGAKHYQNWYLIRIPLADYTRKYGNINSFQNITHMRVWATGYKRPFTLRFATFEFVGSQWTKVDNLTETPSSLDGFEVSTINIEENAERTPFPYRQPVGSIRAVNRGAQIQTVQNEQSLVLSVEGLEAGQMHMVKKIFGQNLLNYSNMRMFVHGEGFDERGDAELVVRLGSDLENNFYEYRQPVTPSEEYNFQYDPNNTAQQDAEAEYIWMYEENSMNILISAFNVLKQLRDAENIDPNELYELTGLMGEEAVEGAVLAIKGNPSLDKVNEIGIGIRNPYDPTDPNTKGTPVLDAEFWVNELRVSGFDNENGWAANAKGSIKFADFATLTSNFTRRTTGFGGLSDRFEARSTSDQLGITINSTINLHKLVPDRFGWNFPVSVTTSLSSQTPKYLPDQGDVRVSDFVEAVNSDETLTSEQKKDSINTRIQNIQTESERFSINFSDISKKNSRSKLAQYTIDNMRLTYVYNTENSRNPGYQFQDKWNYSAGFNYNLSLRKVRLFSPFGFTRKIPVVKALSGLRLGYFPSSITFSTGLTRNYSESRRRNIADLSEQYALKQTHNFTQRNNFSLNYNLTPNIPISFRSTTNFDLASAGIKPRQVTGIDSLSFDVVPTFDVFKGIISDTLTARRSTYQESYTSSWRPNLSRIKALDWLNYNLSYSGGFQWNNSLQGSNRGASIGNNLSLDNSVKIDLSRIYKRLGFFEKIRTSDVAETKERKQLRDIRRKEISTGVPDSLRTPRPEPNLLYDARYLARKVFLAAFSMQSISSSYKRTKSGTQPGYEGDSQIFYAFNSPGSSHYSPPIGYRTGFIDRIPLSQLIDNKGGETDAKLPANNSVTDDFRGATRLTPFETLSIDLDWSAVISNRRSETITVSPLGEYSSVVTESGSYSSSMWAFGSGYEDFFRRQLATAYADINESEGEISDESGNGDGRIVLNRNTMEEDFRRAYLGKGVGTTGDKGLFAFPRPNWRISWTRLERFIPFLGKYMSSATLMHSYKGLYKVDWMLNTLNTDESSQSLGDFRVKDVRELYEPSAIRAEQRFSPLLDLNITWNSNVKTQFGYDRSTITSFAVNSKRVTEQLDQGFDFSMNYTFKNVRIKLFPNIKNNIDVSPPRQLYQ